MERLYFTFGSDPAFPFDMEDYVLVIGKDTRNCLDAFKKKHPNRPGSDCINCADFYQPRAWDERVKNHYKDKEPKEVIVSCDAYGSKPEGFEPIWFAVPAKNDIIFLQTGSGDNLLFDDRQNGYVDYLDYSSFELDHGEVSEADGGMFMTKEYVQDRYSCLADAIPDILDDLYGDPYMDAVIISTI